MALLEILEQIDALPYERRTLLCPFCGHTESLRDVAINLDWGTESHETTELLTTEGDWYCEKCTAETVGGIMPTISNLKANPDLVWTEGNTYLVFSEFLSYIAQHSNEAQS